MYKSKIMLLYNEEECFYIKTGLLNFKYCSTNLDMLVQG